MNHESGNKKIVRSVQNALFVISAALFMATVYNAVQGKPLDLTGMHIWLLEPGALIAAGIVTLTWIFDGLACKLRLPKSKLDWYCTAALALAALLVDVGFVASLMLHIPLHPLLPLLVVVGHGGVHALQWVITSWEEEHRPGGVLSSDYVPPEQRIAELEQSFALLKQSNAELEQRASGAEAKLRRHTEERKRTFTETCPYCKEGFTHRTLDKAVRAVRAHKGTCEKKPVASTNGHHHKEHA